MSLEQNQLRVKIRNTTDIEKITELKRKRNNILKNITKRVNKIKEERIDAILHELESVNDDHRMFKAVRKLHQKPFEIPTIHNDKDKIVTSPQGIHKIIQHHFKNHFHKEDVTEMERHICEPKPLTQIITTEEIVKVLTKLSNQKYPGKDNIPFEVLKNAPNVVHQQILMIMNNTFSEGEPYDFGTGILFTLPKPNKLKGAVKSLVPIILLEISRKSCPKSC